MEGNQENNKREYQEPLEERKLTSEEKKALKEEAREILEHKKKEIPDFEEREKRKNQTFWSRVKEKFSFEKFEFLEQSDTKKKEIALLIKQQNSPDRLYWMEIILSTLIATFGLLQNSVAVIIGAMLIAPLIRPMQGMSFAMATGQSSFFWKATGFLLRSVIVSIFISFVFAILIPLKIEQPEILARTSPNILDLFIAICSAIIALLSLGFTRLSSSVAGVAMAASLMPPLAVVGIELSLGNISAAWGSFLLFFVNFLAIILVGVVVLIAYGFTPTQEIKKQVSFRKIFTLLVIILCTSIPLYSSLSDISTKISVEQKSRNLLQKVIPEKIPEGKLKELKVLNVTDTSIELVGQLQVPENVKIFTSSKSAIISELENYFHKKVVIDFETIRTANFSSPNVSNKMRQNLLTAFQTYSHELIPTFTSLQISATEKDKNIWEISSIVSVPDGEFLTDKIKKAFLDKFAQNFDEKVTIKWVTIAGSPKQKSKKKLTKNQIIQRDITNSIQEFLSRPEMKGVEIENINIDIHENTETKEIEKIIVSARVLYIQNKKKKQLIENEKMEKTVSAEDILNKMKILSEKGELSDEVIKKLLSEYTSGEDTEKQNKTDNGDSPKFVSQNEITEDLKDLMKSLSYSNIVLHLDYISYIPETIMISSQEENQKSERVGKQSSVVESLSGDISTSEADR